MPRTADHARDYVPHLPDLLVTLAAAWREVRDAQTEVDPFGPNFRALEATQASISGLCDRLTGQTGFLRLKHPGDDLAA